MAYCIILQYWHPIINKKKNIAIQSQKGELELDFLKRMHTLLLNKAELTSIVSRYFEKEIEISKEVDDKKELIKKLESLNLEVEIEI